MSLHEYISELAKKEFRDNFLRVDSFDYYYDGSDMIGEVVIQHEEDDDVVLDKLARIYDATDSRGLSVSLGWTVADWAIPENQHQEV